VVYDLNRTDELRHRDKLDCSSIWEHLVGASEERRQAIERCIAESESELEELDALAKELGEPDRELDYERFQVTQRRFQYRTEQDVEAILSSRSMDLFKKKCRVEFLRRTRALPKK
jgi:Intermembrane space protein MIX23